MVRKVRKDLYLKCFDHIKFFKLEVNNFERFVTKVFDNDVLNDTGERSQTMRLKELNISQISSFNLKVYFMEQI